jgi:ubiquinone/menaquinone biosynthesis C-methylase UbiE
MKNTLNDKPSEKLNGRLIANVGFIDNKNIKGKNILDIGCGYGWCELNFISRGAKKVTGIEISDEDLKTAVNNIKNKNIIFKVGSAINLPFKDHEFDTVVCWEVIEHIPKDTENKMFKEVYRVLKPKGSFYLSTPYKNFFSNIFDPAWWLIGHRHYSLKQLEYFAKKNKFSVVSYEIKGKFWSILSILNMYFSKWVFRRRPFWTNYIQSKDNEEYKIKNGFVNIFVKYIKK